MGLRFRRSIKIAPGLKLNINKNSVGLSAGTKGAHVSVNTKGDVTRSVGIPGTGLSYSERSRLSKGKNNTGSSNNNFNSNANHGGNPNPQNDKPPFYQRTWFIILFLFLFPPLGIFFLWKYKRINKPLKVVISVVFLMFFIMRITPAIDKPVDTDKPVVETANVTETIKPDAPATQVEEVKPNEEVVPTEVNENTQIASDKSKTKETPVEVATEEVKKEEATTVPETSAVVVPVMEIPESSGSSEIDSTKETSEKVYVTKTGKKYHYDSNCNGGTYYESTLEKAENMGLKPCSKCVK